MNQHAQWDIVTGVGITARQRRTVAVDLREDWPAAVSTARAVEIAQRYRRPLDEMALQSMQSSVLVTARAEGQRVQQATGG
jgi:hypothetical protein